MKPWPVWMNLKLFMMTLRPIRWKWIISHSTQMHRDTLVKKHSCTPITQSPGFPLLLIVSQRKCHNVLLWIDLFYILPLSAPVQMNIICLLSLFVQIWFQFPKETFKKKKTFKNTLFFRKPYTYIWFTSV